jgi:four helix bundle protein
MAEGHGLRRTGLPGLRRSERRRRRGPGIAEGHGRPNPQFLHFVRIAKGSLQEADTQLELLLRRGVAKTETLLQLLRDADELGKVLYGLMRSLGDA